ncbi:MAG: PH domain-containing protein [Verrucomicrobiae bacterium]|nr:PH domain-containing protein [Verrucomicrobiae bacterium]
MESQITPSSPESSSAETESVLWEGTPSQWQNFGWWISCLLVIPIPFAIWKAISIANFRITLTKQRLRIRSGVFTKANEDIELYRVKDWSLSEPLLQRMFGCGQIEILSSDRTAPELHLRWITGAGEFVETLRAAVEAVRDRKRVREVDMGFEGGDELEFT